MKRSPHSKLLFALFGLFACSSYTYADESPEEQLKSLQSRPLVSSSDYYNVGSLDLKLGKAGLAIAYLEKANHLKPHDRDIQQNLKLAREALAQTIGEENLDPASNWMEVISDRASLEEVRGVLGLCGFFLLALWLRSYLKTRKLRKTLLHAPAILTILGALATTGVYFIERASEGHPPGVCIEAGPIRSGPGAEFTQISQTGVGVKFRVLEANPNWLKIRYSSDAVGWIPASSLLLL